MKVTVQVVGPAFSGPVIFNVKDKASWLSLFGAGGITLSKNTARLRYDMATALSKNPHLIVHEATHILQARRMGFGYLPTYAWQAIKSGFRKQNIPMEQEAYNNESGADFIIL
jgi:hypothetical protein